MRNKIEEENGGDDKRRENILSSSNPLKPVPKYQLYSHRFYSDGSKKDGILADRKGSRAR